MTPTAEPPAADSEAADSPAAVQDPGLQAERTRLAWSRTSLALAVVGALELHPTHTALSWWHRLPGAVTLAIAVVVWVHGGRRYRTVRSLLASGRPIVAEGEVLFIALLIVIPAAAAIWAMLV